jgi:acetate kinase
MGTRPGDLDPGVVLHLLRIGMSLEEVEWLLNHGSGLLALAGTRDMKELLSRSDSAARFAVEVFCYRVRKYVGVYLAVQEGAEAVVFTGGIGERSPEIGDGSASRWHGQVLSWMLRETFEGTS